MLISSTWAAEAGHYGLPVIERSCTGLHGLWSSWASCSAVLDRPRQAPMTTAMHRNLVAVAGRGGGHARSRGTQASSASLQMRCMRLDERGKVVFLTKQHGWCRPGQEHAAARYDLEPAPAGAARA